MKHTDESTTYHEHYTVLWVNSVIAVALLVILSIPLIGNMRDLQAQLNTTQTETYVQEQQQLQQAQAELQLEQFGGRETTNAVLPSEEMVVDFVELLEDIAADQQLTHALSLETEQRTVTNGVVEISGTLQLTGSLGYMIQFFSELESTQYYINPVAIRITGDGESQTLSMDMLSYWTESQ